MIWAKVTWFFGTRFAKIGLPLLAIIGVFWAVFSFGSSHGAAEIQGKWDRQKQADAVMVAAEKAKIAKEQATHNTNDRRVSDELSNLQTSAAADVARIRGESALRLWSSDERAALFRAAAQSGAAERDRLAIHAAELDRAVAAGIGLVEELRTTLATRDGQIKALASQIQNDRQLINGSGDTNGQLEPTGR